MISRSFVALVVSLMCSVVFAQEAAKPRIGWEESFDDIGRWKTALENPRGSTPMTEVKQVDGCLWFRTPVGALNPNMKRADWPEWPANPGTSFTNWEVKYDDVVDIDQYPYIVIRIPEKGTYLSMSICGQAVKVPYTTGIHSQDLRTLGLAGRQRISFYCQTLNSHSHVKIDYIRLVSELTDEEKKGFIDEGLSVRAEDQKPVPYHGLDAMNARAGRPNRTGEENSSEWLVYRDTGTGAEVWKMTDRPENEDKPEFNCDGSAMTVHGRPGGGFHIFDWTTGKFTLVEGGLSDARPRFSTVDPAGMLIAENEWLPRTADARPREVTIYSLNFRTGEKTKVASFQPKGWVVQEWNNSPDSAKMVFGLRESPNVWLIDPTVADVDRRVTYIKLPTRLKGISLQNSDTEISWYNCYTYQRLIMDLKTGEVTQGNTPAAGGHSAGGPHWTVGPYSQLMKILTRNGAHPQTEATADNVKIFANYREPVSTDYGHVSANGRWVVTDGVSGDVAGQHLMISTDDPAAVLRVCHHNTSRNDWVTNTYSRSSPDVTKVAWVSDQFDDGDIYVAITGRPKPPTDLKAERAGDDIKLTWKAPENTKEVGGYRVYRSETSGKEFKALNAEPVKTTTFSDRLPGDGAWFYLVAAVEPSGVEGNFSEEAVVTPGGPAQPERRIFVEAENLEWTAPMRLVLHGSAWGSRYLRYHKAAVAEPDEGVIRWTFRPPAGAKYTTLLWCRNESKGEDWHWQEAGVDPAAGLLKVIEEGFAVDQIAFTSTGGGDAFDTHRVMIPLKPAGLDVADVTPQSIRLRWKPNEEKNISRYDIHVSDDPRKLGNATIIGSTKDTQFLDWGLRPGTKYTYHVVAVNTRGKRSSSATLEATTAAQTIQQAKANPAEGEGMVKAAPKIIYKINVKEEAPFMAWVKYSPAYVPVKDQRVAVEIDGKAAGNWQLRSPYRPMSWVLASKGKGTPRTFVDKLEADGKDVFTLTPGEHTITLTCADAPADEQHAFGEIVLTNDHSFRPEGYDPRANFKKRN